MVKSRTLDDFYEDQDISVDAPEVLSPPPSLPSLSPTPYNPPPPLQLEEVVLPPLAPTPFTWIFYATITLSVLAALRHFVLVPRVQRERKRWLQGSGVVLPSGSVGVPGLEAARVYLACRRVCQEGGPHTTFLEQWVDASEEEVQRELMVAVTPALTSLKEALNRMAGALEAFPGGGGGGLGGDGESEESFPGFIEAVLSQGEECATLVGGSDFAQLQVLAVGVQQCAVSCVRRATDAGLESLERVQALLSLLKRLDCGEEVLHPLKPIILWERALSHLVEVSRAIIPEGVVDAVAAAKESLERLDTALHEEATAAELIPRPLNATRRGVRKEAERAREALLNTFQPHPPNPTLLMDAGGGGLLLEDTVGGAGARGVESMSIREGLGKGGGQVLLESGERGGGRRMGVEDFAHLTVALQGMNLADQQRRHQELMASHAEHHNQLMGVQTEAAKSMKEELGRVSNTLQNQFNASEAKRAREEEAEEGLRHWRTLLVALQLSLALALLTALALLWDTIQHHLAGYLPEGVCWNYHWATTSGWEKEGEGGQGNRGGFSLLSSYTLWILPTFGGGGWGGGGGFSLLSHQLWSCARQWALVMLAMYPLGFLPTSLLPPIINFFLTTPVASLPLAAVIAFSSIRNRAFAVTAMLLGPNLGVYWCKRHLGGLIKTRCSGRGASSLVGKCLLVALQVAVVGTCGLGCGTYVVDGSITNTWRVGVSLLKSIYDLLQ